MPKAQREHISKGLKTPENSSKSAERLRKLRTGTHLSDYTKQLLRDLNKGGNSAKARKVLCIETNQSFFAVSEAAQWANIHYSGIVKVCLGKQHTAAGYTWKYI